MSEMSGHFTTTDPVTDLIALLDVERLDRNLFRGPAKRGATGRAFGGQVVAQAFMAAQRSIDDDKIAHSLHAYFLRPGSEAAPIILQVERDFDGGSFANRRVIALQSGEPLLTLSASFHRPEGGFAHGTAMPAVPAPDTLPSLADLAELYGDTINETARNYLLRPSAFEMRPVGQPSFLQRGKAKPIANTWFRLRGQAPADETVRRSILSYMSDYSLLSSSFIPHDVNLFEHSFQTASLDHAVWFHDEAPLDDWFLYSTESDWAGRGRAHATGAIFARDGRIVARTAQEGLARARPDRPAGGTLPHTP